jgi:hypothetical protein
MKENAAREKEKATAGANNAEKYATVADEAAEFVINIAKCCWEVRCGNSAKKTSFLI